MRGPVLLLIAQGIMAAILITLLVAVVIIASAQPAQASDPRPTPCVRAVGAPVCPGVPTPRPTPLVVGLPLPDTDTMP